MASGFAKAMPIVVISLRSACRGSGMIVSKNSLLMKTSQRRTYLCFYLGLMVLAQACAVHPPNKSNHNQPEDASQENEAAGAHKEQALAIANERAQKTYNSLKPFKVVACETARTWIIIYDNGGPEYVISKPSGRILVDKRQFQPRETQFVSDESSKAIDPINALEAVEIAKRKGTQDFGDLGHYSVFACELSRALVVIFEYKEVPGELLPNSRSPFYLIDKKTGNVIHKGG